MLLTLHSSVANSVAGVCSFTLNQSYNIESATVKRIFITADSSYHTGTADANIQDIILYGQFTSGFSTHLTHTCAGTNKSNEHTFPLGVLKYVDYDGGTYRAYDSGPLSYEIAGPGTMSSSIQLEVGEFVNDPEEDPPVTVFESSNVNLGTIEGTIIVVLDVVLDGLQAMNEGDV
jgi:hypothetical protein